MLGNNISMSDKLCSLRITLPFFIFLNILLQNEIINFTSDIWQYWKNFTMLQNQSPMFLGNKPILQLVQCYKINFLPSLLFWQPGDQYCLPCQWRKSESCSPILALWSVWPLEQWQDSSPVHRTVDSQYAGQPSNASLQPL